MATNIFRSYVIAVTTNDEFDDSVTHVAAELRPSAILCLAYASLCAWLVRKLFGWMHFYHIEIAVSGTTWLNYNPVEDDFPEEWEEGAVEAEIDPVLIDEAGLVFHSAQVAGDGGLWFTCSHKHSGTEFSSHEVLLLSLVQAIRPGDVLAELREWFGKTRLGNAFAGGAA